MAFDFQDPALLPIQEKVAAGVRLEAADGVSLFRSADLLGVGYLAQTVRQRRHGRKAYYIYNQHINYSNICVNGCKFCAFSRKAGETGAYEMALAEIYDRVKERLHEPITEIHIVGGCHPELPFAYYLDMLKGIKELRPEVHLQAFTAVEVAHLADRAGLSLADTLGALQEAGLGSLPGGGAEVFSPRVRASLCPEKLSPQGWLEVSQAAHRLGLNTNATMLYGHLETVEERVDHLLKLRAAQDETGGFLTFIPLAFHPANTGLSELSGLPAAAGQLPPHQGLLGDAGAQAGPDFPVFRGGRHRRHRDGGAHHPHGRGRHPPGPDPGAAQGPHPGSGLRAGGAGHAL
jgi:aminodeoxyfutalosine synthase